MYTLCEAACARYGRVVTRESRKGRPSLRAAGGQHVSGQDGRSFACLVPADAPKAEHSVSRLGYLAIEDDPKFVSPPCAPTKGPPPDGVIVIRSLWASRSLRGSQMGPSHSICSRHPFPTCIKQPAGILAMSLTPCTPIPSSDSIRPTLRDCSRVGSGPARIPHSANGVAVPFCPLANPFGSLGAVLNPPWTTRLPHQEASVADEARAHHA